MELPPDIDVRRLLGSIQELQRFSDSIRVYDGHRALYELDLHACWRYINSTCPPVSHPFHDFIDKLKVQKQDLWRTCIRDKASKLSNRENLCDALLQWDDAAPWVSYALVPKQNSPYGGGSEDGAETFLSPDNEMHSKFIVVAAQLSRIIGRKLELHFYDVLKKALANPSINRRLVLDVGRTIMSLRRRLAQWTQHWASGTALSAPLGDEACLGGGPAERAERVRNLCQILYFYFCYMRRRLSPDDQECMRTIEVRYPDSEEAVEEGFPQYESLEGFEEWLRFGDQPVSDVDFDCEMLPILASALFPNLLTRLASHASSCTALLSEDDPDGAAACPASRSPHCGLLSRLPKVSAAHSRTPFVQPKPSTTSYSPPPPAAFVELSRYFSNMTPTSRSVRPRSLGVSDVDPPVASHVQKGEVPDVLVRGIAGGEGGGDAVEALHEDVHVRGPDVGLIPLLARPHVAGGDAAGAGVEISGHAVEGAGHGVGVVLEMVGGGARPEGVELADVEEDLLAGGRGAAVVGGGVSVGGDVDVVGRRREVVVEVAEEGFVPEDGLDGGAAARGAGGPRAGGAGVARPAVEARDGELVAVEDGVEVDGDDGAGVERPQGEVDVADGVGRVGEPARGVVVAALGAGGEVGVQLPRLRRAEARRLGVDDARGGVVGAVGGGGEVLAERLGPRLRVAHGVALQRVRPVADGDGDGAVPDPEVVLPDQQRQRPRQDGRVVGVLDVDAHHARQQRRLRPVQVVQPRAVGDEAEALDEVQQVLDRVARDAHKGAPRAQKALDDPVRVPVVRLAEAPAGDDERAADRDEAAGARRAVGRGARVAARQVGPHVDDGRDELPDDGVVELGEEDGVRREAGSGHLLELAAGVCKVRRQKVLQRGVVPEGLGEPVEGGLDFCERSFGRPGLEPRPSVHIVRALASDGLAT
ncbi:hypothetical protein Trco_007820 [Trichoderma cornu-damae]|uniref:Uncharacterized protein n=1 Tax=Trichoderma cornu-damae TaxID=654480 RepID=A0A9P8TUP1_9HYPO|nr:hypothetical protein Trco_007820 [Trichoderma cornu-damae]